MLHGSKRSQRRARALRKAMSLPEVLLWQALRKRTLGLKFRHQHPAGRYVLDFFCVRYRLAIEVDGMAHECGNASEYDARRDAWIRRQGVRVLRIRAADVLGNLSAVVDHIAVTARGDYPSTAFGGSPPPPGED